MGAGRTGSPGQDPPSIDDRIEQWRERLLEFSKRNPLVNMRLGDRGALEVKLPSAGEVWINLFAGQGLSFPWKRALLGLGRVEQAEEPDDSDEWVPGQVPVDEKASSGRKRKEKRTEEMDHRELDLEACRRSSRFSSGHLLTSQTDKHMGRRLTRLNLNGRTSLSETGVNILFMTFGALRWYESADSDVPMLAPLLLVPVRLMRETLESPWSISYEDEDIATNFTMGQKVASEFGMTWPELAEDFDPSTCGFADYFDQVRECVSAADRWTVEERVGLGTFSFQKIAMWRDLGENKTSIAAHDICRAIAGESSGPSGSGQFIDMKEVDETVRPRELHSIRDCDSTQLEAILAAKAGVSFVLDGPPGTGKSQTISNIISEFIAAGKTVLFVSEKAAALEVVKRRLDEAELGDFCLECHSHKSNKKVVLAELQRCLNLEPQRFRDQQEDLERLYETRAKLTGYVRSLHQSQSALQLTPYQVHGRLAEVPARGVSRCAIAGVLDIDRQSLRRMEEAIEALTPHQKVVDIQERHPWRGTRLTSVSLTDEDDIRHRFTATASAIDALLPVLQSLAEFGFGPADCRLEAIAVIAADARQIAHAPEVPGSWLSSSTAQTCESVVSLHSDAELCSTLSRALPDYRTDAHVAWAAKLEGSVTALASPWVSRFKRIQAPSLRSEVTRFADATERLKALEQQLGEVRSTSRALGEALRQSTTGITLQGAEQLLAIGEMVVGLDEVQFGWVDHDVRARLRAVVDECLPLSQALEKTRAVLEGVGLAAGYDDAGAAVALEAEWYSSFWRRLTPSWFGLKGRTRALYRPGVLRGTAEMLADMRELRSYHQHRNAILQACEPVARQLPKITTSEAWSRFGTTLEKMDQLRSWCTEGEALLSTLATPGGINRALTRRLCDALTTQIASVRQVAQGISPSWRIDPVEAAGAPLELVPLRNAASALNSASDAVGAAASLLTGWAGLLLPERDIPAAQFNKDSQLLSQLASVHGRLTSTVASLKGRIPDVSNPAGHDWSELAEAARWVLETLSRNGGQVPPHVATIVTEPEARKALMAALAEFDRTIPGVNAGILELKEVFHLTADVSTGITLLPSPVSQVREWLDKRASDAHLLHEWTEFRRAVVAIERLGLKELAAEVCTRKVALADVRSAFLKRFYRAWLDAVYEKDPVLQDFRFEDHEKLIEQFRGLDRASIAGSARRIRQALLTSPDRPSPTNSAPGKSELGTLLREANKKRKHLPLRLLFRQIPTLLVKLKPCVMMSPLAVSTFFDSEQLRFDLVIFDEASQVRPQDAIGVIYRGKQLIVAGDQRQLPPTSFFAAASRDDSTDEEEEEDDIADFDSILDVGVSTGMARKSLRWHYRSRRESLIAFSNHHIYEGGLVTFPSAHDTPGSSAVSFVHVPEGRWIRSGSSARNPIEARRVAEVVFGHFKTNPDRSLGVVAFSQAQQLAILDEIEKLRRANPELEEFFDEERDEPFFVKNLENVQGDERNVIVVSVGYARDPAGKFSMNFGPINKKGGERRLNVLVTRATHEIKLVSSVQAHDLDLGRTNSRGVELLKAYLDYAERGVETLGLESKEVEADDDSPFEAEVSRALRDLGHDVRRQIGCSGYRIDLAIVHPQRAGEFVLGIECDGATYHSSMTARDRDRLRQQILEDLGWNIVRVWSTDWVRQPKRQIDRILRAYEHALRAGPSRTASGRTARLPEEEPAPVVLSPRAPQASMTFVYERIEDVPQVPMTNAILGALKRYGSTPQEDVIRHVAQSLGFQRLGKKIRNGIESVVFNLIETQQVVHHQDGRLALGKGAFVSNEDDEVELDSPPSE